MEEWVPKPSTFALRLVSHPSPHFVLFLTDLINYPRYTGSNVIVAGTAIFGAESPEAVIQQLKDVVNTAQAKAQS